MRTIKLVIEYEGTRYYGWQAQAGGNTVQQELAEAIERVVRAPVTVQGSGRTDSGVHAIGQVAHFETDSRVPAHDFIGAINANLPEDIAVKAAEDAPEGFHARYSARRKTYRYTILHQPARPVIERRFALWVKHRIDLDRMRRGAEYLIGEHDFAAFETRSDGLSGTRTIERLEINRNGPRITVEITADGFLYNMVRSIVGTLLAVARGRLEPEDVKRILDARDRRLAGETAPACGLCLMSVQYD